MPFTMGTFRQMSILIFIFLLLRPPGSSAQQPVFYHNTLRNGGSNGGVLLTLIGKNFAKNQFNFGSGNEHLGNKVVLASDTKTFPCDIHPDGNTETQITCYTRPMPQDHYYIRISVDGELIPDANMCGGRAKSSACSHKVLNHYTPILNELSSISGPPGSAVKISGRIFTTRYGSNLGPAANGRSESILRIYSGGSTCELKDLENDTFYGIELTSTYWGYMNCKLQGTFVGSFNISFLISGSFGRSLPKRELLKVSTAGKIYLFQTYAEITSVYPKEGSIMGGTLMTIKGKNFDETSAKAKVFVGDTKCDIVKPVNDDTIVCRVAPKPTTLPTVHAGNRGLQMEYWTSNVGNNIYNVIALNSSSPSYKKIWIESAEFYASGEYGARIQGLFKPMYDGFHTFSSTSNGYRQIRLSSNESRENAKLIRNGHGAFLNTSKRYYLELTYVNTKYKINDLTRLQIFSLNSSVTNRETGLAQNTKQLLSVCIETLREIQVIKLEDLQSRASVDEIQELSISKPVHVGEDAAFRLTFGGTASVPLSGKATPSEVRKALEGLPMIGARKVAVTANFTVNAATYFIILKHDVGKLPLIGVEPIPDKNGNNLIVKVDTNFKGTASNKQFAFYLDDVMSPILPIDASAQMVKNALDEMFSVRCQQFITDPDSNSIFRNDFELLSDSSHNGLKVYDKISFCGKGSVKNPNYVFWKGQIQQIVYLENYPTMCAAFRGDANINLEVKFNYKLPSVAGAQQKTHTISTHLSHIDDWKYICFDILEAVKVKDAILHLLDSINIKRLSTNDDIYMDSIILTRIPQQDEALVLTKAMVRQLPPLSDRLIVKELQVTKLGKSMYKIAMESYNCTADIPLFETLPNTLTPDRNESVTTVPVDQLPAGVWRLQAASPSLGGSFRLQYGNEISADIPAWTSESEMKYYLEAMPTMGTMAVNIEGNCTCKYYTLEWLSNPGHKDVLKVITDKLTGINVTSSIKITRYGGYIMRPVPGEHFRTIHGKPQVTAFINDIITATAPGSDASFEWKTAATPTITNVYPSQGPVPINLTITGTQFNNTVISSNKVTIDSQDCKILSASSTQIVCTLLSCSLGVHDVSVVVDDKGTALADGNPVQFTGKAKVLSVNPDQGSYEGGTPLTIKGYGFNREMVVKMDDDTCEDMDITLNEIRCITPPQKDSSYTRRVHVEIDNKTDVEGGTNFTYTSPVGNVTNVNISSAKVTGGEPILLTGTNLDSASHLEIGHAPANILLANATNVLAIMPAQEPGVHNIQLTISNGYAEISGNIKSINQALYVSSMKPDQGSLFGGTWLTITGKGFDVHYDKIKVSVGPVPCIVDDFSDSWIRCQLDHTVKTHQVMNPGIHPEYKKDADKKPMTMHLKVGDSVQWYWSVPIWLRSVNFQILQIDNPFSIQPIKNGFKSGNKTHNGAFTHRFPKSGTFYFWGGTVDLTEGVVGVIYVKPRRTHVEVLSVTVGHFEAEYKSSSSASVSSLSSSSRNSCNAQHSPIDTCNENKNSVKPNTFSFYFSECSTPIVSSVTPNLLTGIDDILLRGKGFSTRQCENIITFGNQSCVSKAQNTSHLTCAIDVQRYFLIGVQLPLKLLVDNRGYALIDITPEDANSIVLLPHIDSISPKMGSILGGTKLTIRGGGFKCINTSVQIFIGSDNCQILSANRTMVVCETLPGKDNDLLVQLVVIRSKHKIPARCKISSNCTFTYSGIITPNVTNISPTNVSTNGVKFTIEGKGFGSNPADISVTIGSTPCLASSVNHSHITCKAGYIGAGWNSLKVHRASIGNMVVDNEKVWSHPYVSKVHPPIGSLHGGTVLTVYGNGFVDGRTSIKIGNKECNVLMTNQTQVQCSTQANSMGIQLLVVTSNGQNYVPHIFIYATSHTPSIVSISPTTGKAGDILTIVGSGLVNETGHNTVLIGDSDGCTVVSVSANFLNCTLGHKTAGKYLVTVNVVGKGSTNKNIFLTNQLSVESINPSTGSLFGGQMLTLKGNGFDVNKTKVRICSRECLSPTPTIQSDSTFICITPSLDENSSTKNCVVNVSVGHFNAASPQSYQYSDSKTAQIARVDPTRGGTRGGTRITITGTGFSTNKDDMEISIDKANCTILKTSSTEIECETTQHLDSVTTKVDVTIKGSGLANNTVAEYAYIDVWSSRSTWGNADPPGQGEFVIIRKGQKLLLDTDTPILKMLLIQGGILEFEEKDIELKAENILITDGGKLQIGSEEKPFQHKAIITMYGHLRGKELPIYGAKTLALREGTIDLHGRKIQHTWTHLAATAYRGANSILLKHAVPDWKVGDEIVIASTGGRHSQKENEKHTIAAISDDFRNVTLTEKLKYEHVSVTETVDAVTVEYFAEVGLLTRNVVVRGSVCKEWSEKIEACPEGFNTGEFAVQTCFQGRFGEEMGSDEFGVQIMVHAPVMNKHLAVVHLSHVEVTYAGQAFRLGRYPVHFHLNGDMSGSYVKSCAIHHTFNRAINIHGTHRVLVEHNVVYNVMGGALFLEDGIETNNIFRYNLVVFVRPSTSLRNDDVTPASFWITNPNNIVVHNSAAGGSHFGFWYRMLLHPEGPSFTSKICPRNVRLGRFYNNSAHSFGWFGLWTFPTYTPQQSDSCKYWKDATVVFEKLTAWNCEKGAETVDSGQLQLDNFVLANNEFAGYEGKVIVRGNQYTPESISIKNSVIIGKSSALKSKPTKMAIVLPFGNGMRIQNITFVNFVDKTVAFGLTRVDGKCNTLCGGFLYETSGLKFIDTPNKALFSWENAMILYDLDGTLTGTANSKVVATNGLLPPTCTKAAAFSSSKSASICPPEVKFHRFAFNKIYPKNMQHRDLLVSNKHGNTSAPYKFFAVTHKEGWMLLLVNGLEHKISFLGAKQVTNISYEASFYQFAKGDHVSITQYKDTLPDRFSIDNKRTFIQRSLKKPTYATSGTGDWFYNSTEKTMTYFVSYKARLSRSKRSATLTSSRDRSIRFSALRCFYLNCEAPKDPRSFPPATKRPDTFYLWSAKETWSTIGKLLNSSIPARLPTENDNVTIPEQLWVVVDVDLPKLNALHLYGQLEISNDLPKITINVSYIYIRGGRLILGWENEPYPGDAIIEMRGTQSTPNFPITAGPNLGASFIGVFGGLDLHGKKRMVPWTRIASTLKASEKQLTLEKAVDWKVGEEIVVAATGYNPWETETFRITAVSSDRKTLTLNTTATHEHIAYKETIAGMTMILSAEVGLLTRNIKFTGSWYKNMERDMFGARIIAGVTQTSLESVYVGYIRLSNVEFIHTGQYGWATNNDPRYSVAFHNLGKIDHKLRPTYIKNCAFHHCFSSAIGIYGSNGLTIENNVIHRTIGSAIITESDSTKIRNHLITLVVCPAVYILRFNLKGGIQWPAGIEAVKVEDFEISDNAVAGSERMGYHVIGEDCDKPSQWSNNYVRGALLGVGQFPEDSVRPKKECVRYFGFYIFRCVEAGIYHNQVPGFILENSIFAEITVSVCPIVNEPAAVTHKTSNKKVDIRNTVFVGLTASYDCNIDRLDKTNPNIMLSMNARSKTPDWSIGLISATFLSGGNKAPKKPLFNIMSYPAIVGNMTIENVTFAHFNHKCGEKMKTAAFAAAIFNDDGQHPVTTKRIRKTDVKSTNLIYIPRPNVGKINSADCVDMDCDGLKKVLIVDEDGTFVGGQPPVSVFSQSEFEWNGDKRRGLGDYRIPKVMLTSLNGSRIPVDKVAPYKGIIRNPRCKYEATWQAYKCTNSSYAMLIVESLDEDTETRRLSPLAVLSNGYVDLINGPQDHGWCSGYTCRKRISTFMVLVELGKTYHLFFSSTSPQKLRLRLLNTDKKIVVSIYYSRPNRLDVYDYTKTYVSPKDKDAKTSLRISNWSKYKPLPTDPDGTNYFDDVKQQLYVTVQGGRPVDIKMVPVVRIQFSINSLSEQEFFGEQLVRNLALFLQVPASKVRIVSAVSESSTSGNRRKRSTGSGLQITAQIGDPPASTITTNSSTTSPSTNSTNDNSTNTLSADDLTRISSHLANAQQLNTLNNAINYTVSNMVLTPAAVPVSDPSWKNQDGVSSFEVKVPASLKIVVSPVTSYEGGVFKIGPCLRFYDSSGAPIDVLGTPSNPWRLKVNLLLGSGSDANAVLTGDTEIDIKDGWANFTSLVISHKGTNYGLQFKVVFPSASKFNATIPPSLVVLARPLALRLVPNPQTVIANQDVDLRVFLKDKVTGATLSNIQWRGHSWAASAKLMMPFLYQGEVTNLGNSALYDAANNYLVFSKVSFSKAGIYILQITTTSTPSEYTIIQELEVTVFSSTPPTTTDTITSLIKIVVDIDYTKIEGGKENYFRVLMINYFMYKFPDVQFKNVAVSKSDNEKVNVHMEIYGESNAVISASKSICNMADNQASLTFQSEEAYIVFTTQVNGTRYLDSNCGDVNGRIIPQKAFPVEIIIGVSFAAVFLILVAVIFLVWRFQIMPKAKIKDAGNYRQEDTTVPVARMNPYKGAKM